MHRWFAYGTDGKWVFHSSEPASRGNVSDGNGVLFDQLGPFTSARKAREVADALNEAYKLGRDDMFNELAEGSK
jgi:hypothetical protein